MERKAGKQHALTITWQICSCVLGTMVLDVSSSQAHLNLDHPYLLSLFLSILWLGCHHSTIKGKREGDVF